MTISRRKPAPGKAIGVYWTEKALADLEAIGDYIAADSPAAAMRWVEELMAAAKKASHTPRAGRRVPEIGRDDIREVIKRKYRIVYEVREFRLDVLTVFEGHRIFPEAVVRQHA